MLKLNIEILDNKNFYNIHYGFTSSPNKFGKVLLACIEELENAICALYFIENVNINSEKKLRDKFPNANFVLDMPLTTNLYKKILDEQIDRTISVALKGTEFQINVWKALLDIPRGEQRAYSDVAEMINKRTATRAVANAIAHNEIALLIPCHRVTNKMVNGKPIASKQFQYGWGEKIKRSLLVYEGVEI